MSVVWVALFLPVAATVLGPLWSRRRLT